jgi:hypothetical protein
VSQRVIGEQLCVLDNSIGLSVSRLILTKFQLRREAGDTAGPDALDQQESIFTPPRAPLTLAAHASINLGEVLDIEAEPVLTSDDEEQPPPGNNVEQFDSVTWE